MALGWCSDCETLFGPDGHRCKVAEEIGRPPARIYANRGRTLPPAAFPYHTSYRGPKTDHDSYLAGFDDGMTAREAGAPVNPKMADHNNRDAYAIGWCHGYDWPAWPHGVASLQAGNPKASDQ